jgi:hypothetical protein
MLPPFLLKRVFSAFPEICPEKRKIQNVPNFHGKKQADDKAVYICIFSFLGEICNTVGWISLHWINPKKSIILKMSPGNVICFPENWKMF